MYTIVFQHPIFHLSWSVQHKVMICSWYLPIHGEKTTHLNQGKFSIQRKITENAQDKCITKHRMHLSRMKIISNYDNPSSIMLLEVVNKNRRELNYLYRRQKGWRESHISLTTENCCTNIKATAYLSLCKTM